MLNYRIYKGHNKDIKGSKNKFDNTIYSFDIETSSYGLLNGSIIKGIDYDSLSESEKEDFTPLTCMYIWMFSINDIVYYGRTWDELKEFFNILDNYVPERKIIFVHNLSFEFQFMRSVFEFEDVMARKSRKVMSAFLSEFNMEFRCTLMMSNCALKELPKLFNLSVNKMVGDLDYTLLRTSITPLTDKELGYCENDCLVVYEYIKRELESYSNVSRIPLTSTGHVRRELKSLVMKDFKYRNYVRKSINTNPHIYNLLMEAFMGGYTHANWLYADEIMKDVDSWDFTSSYPYILVTHKFPANEFKKCYIKKREEMNKKFAYLLRVRFTDVNSKYFNTFISASKCKNIINGRYDNGRVISADSLEMTLTDVDFYLLLDSYKCKYEILEIYYSIYKFLPKKFIEFVLEKYIKKTEYKGVKGMELEYAKEKNKFNALYGMSVTNMINDKVIYDNVNGWHEEELSNEEIEEKLYEEKQKGFLSFSYGCWVTAYARNNLIRNIMKVDEYLIYADTDSLKVKKGYDINVINTYNNYVEKKIIDVSKKLDININKYKPKDIKGNERMLGVFDDDGHYKEFITQGAKKYAYIKKYKKEKIEDRSKYNIVKEDDDNYYVLEITVAGVPKKGAMALKSLDEFKDSFVFEFEYTNKNLLMYVDYEDDYVVTDYLGNEYKVTDKSGCCLLPNTYELGKSLDYAVLLNDNSSKRARYKEGV